MQQELPKGFTCECGKEHLFPPYIYAHWDIELIHACECGREHWLQRGFIGPIGPAYTKRKRKT